MEGNIPLQTTPQTIPDTQVSHGKFISVLLFLMFFPVIGLILMWIFMKDWPTRVKRMVTGIYIGIIVVLTLIQFYILFFVVPKNPFYSSRERDYVPKKITQIPSPTLTQNPMTNFYMNEKNGYIISYPAFINCATGDEELRLYEGTICNAGEGLPIITVATNPPVKDYTKSIDPTCYTISTENVMISGQPAIK